MSHRGRLCTHTNTHTHRRAAHRARPQVISSWWAGTDKRLEGEDRMSAWRETAGTMEGWADGHFPAFLDCFGFFFPGKEAAQRISSHWCYNKQGWELTSLCWGSTCVFWRLAQGSPRRLNCCRHTAAAAAGGALKKKPTTTWKWCCCCANISLFCLIWNVFIVGNNAATERITAEKGSCVCRLAGWKEDLERERDLSASEGSRTH